MAAAEESSGQVQLLSAGSSTLDQDPGTGGNGPPRGQAGEHQISKGWPEHPPLSPASTEHLRLLQGPREEKRQTTHNPRHTGCDTDRCTGPGRNQEPKVTGESGETSATPGKSLREHLC